MLPRTTVFELFSTFIQFSNDRFENWITDSQLRKSMTQCMQQPQRSVTEREGFWALYWFQQWQQTGHPLAAHHLSAYLQEACYWAVENVTRRFASAHFSLADGFQGAIARVERILIHYDPTYGSSLKTYARTAFSNFIRDYLRQQKAADICSDWALLRRLSQTQLKQSLHTAGFTQVETDIAIWKCFKAVCIPEADQIKNRTTHALAQPSDELYIQIAERYSQQFANANERANERASGKNSVSKDLIDFKAIDAKVAAASLQRSIQAARAYLIPSVISLNQPLYGNASDPLLNQERDLLNTLSLADGETPMVQMMAAEAYAEQQTKMAAIGSVLEVAIATFETPQQTLLQLYYQEQLTQKEIAHRLGLKQYQVSRQLGRMRQQLLLAVVEWSQTSLHISVESAVLATISEAIHEWLQHTYSVAVSGVDLQGVNLQTVADQTQMNLSETPQPSQSEALT